MFPFDSFDSFENSKTRIGTRDVEEQRVPRAEERPKRKHNFEVVLDLRAFFPCLIISIFFCVFLIVLYRVLFCHGPTLIRSYINIYIFPPFTFPSILNWMILPGTNFRSAHVACIFLFFVLVAAESSWYVISISFLRGNVCTITIRETLSKNLRDR